MLGPGAGTPGSPGNDAGRRARVAPLGLPLLSLGAPRLRPLWEPFTSRRTAGAVTVAGTVRAGSAAGTASTRGFPLPGMWPLPDPIAP